MAVAVVAMTALTASAQEALRSAYFLPGYNFRHELNPALAPERGYVAIPKHRPQQQYRPQHIPLSCRRRPAHHIHESDCRDR